MTTKPGRSIKDLVTITGMSKHFFFDEIAAGSLAAVKFGRDWRIPNDEAIRYLSTKGWPVPAEWETRVVGPAAALR